MTHDFAKTPRRPLPARPPLPVAVPDRPRRLPKGRWILVLALVLITIGYWRYASLSAPPADDFEPGAPESAEYQQALKQQEEEALKAAQAQQRLKANLQAKLEQHEASEPEFGFYDSLPESAWSVQVQHGVYVTEEDRKRASQRYMLQAASVRDLAEAQKIVQNLRKLGMEAFYSKDESGVWYRVNVGPFDNMSKLNKTEDILVSLRMMPLKKKLQ